MIYEQKNFDHLLGIKGFSDVMLANHFALYSGYVKNVNTFLNKLGTKEVGTPEYSELQRRFAWEWNGMRLHELYFGNLKKNGSTLSSGKFKQSLEKIYGNFDGWKNNFITVGTMRGIGWVVLAYDKESNELFNLWINEHDVGHFAGAVPLLVMDVFEHAYITDYGIKKADYIDMFIKSIDWTVVEKRFGE